MMSLPGQLTRDESSSLCFCLSSCQLLPPPGPAPATLPPHWGRRAHKARLSFNKQIKLAVCAVFGAYLFGGQQCRQIA